AEADRSLAGAASMTRWEYARLQSTEEGISVVFTHRQAWTGIAPEAFFQTLRQLGDEGWELVAALPLTVSASPAPTTTAAIAGTAGGAGVPDPREMRDPRDLRPGAPSPPPPQPMPPMTLQVSPDRWLVLKR